ncbi:MAG: B12-binding domain-containing radical SAM protein [Clostridia bacterium]|nr:B12-binding domain-containing radical SAM protein [Clostridia bacterium]
MKIMLINPKIPVYLRMPSIPLGPVSIASYLNAHGHRAIIIERSVKAYDLRAELKRFQPDVIGVSCLSFLSSIDAKRITAFLHRHTNAPVIWGGQAPSAAPELILRDGKPDFVMLGEGEITWLAVANALREGKPLFDIPGLAYLREGAFVSNPVPPVADLFRFPEMDWSLVDPKKYFSTFFHCSKMLYLHASKGCPAACIFCSNKQYHQSCNRCRDPKHVLNDIDRFVLDYGCDGIYFSDELFCPRRELRTMLCEGLISRRYELVWGCQMRLGVLNEEDVKLMYRAGCRWILFGIESGSRERIDAIKKHIDLNLARQTIKWCEDAGITVQASFIIGFPGETCEEMRKTVSFAQSLHSSLVAMNILTPMPNSEIYEIWDRDFPQYQKPDSIKAIARRIEQNVTDLVPWNFSNVPMRELRVVHFFYQWKDFAGKSSVRGDSYGILKKMAQDAFNRIFLHGFSGFIFGTVVSVKQFLTVFFYSHCFPRILKKYGLRLR